MCRSVQHQEGGQARGIVLAEDELTSGLWAWNLELSYAHT